MAGSDSRFDAAAFRTNIRFAMNMGLPVDPALRPTFKWSPRRTYTEEDGQGNPFTWTTSPATETLYSDVQIPCAYEFGAETDRDTNVGNLDMTRTVITVLDEDFAELTQGGVFCDQVEMGGNLYRIDFVAPPYGLFDVTVFQIHATAIDES